MSCCIRAEESHLNNYFISETPISTLTELLFVRMTFTFTNVILKLTSLLLLKLTFVELFTTLIVEEHEDKIKY